MSLLPGSGVAFASGVAAFLACLSAGLERIRLHIEQPNRPAEQHEQQKDEHHCQAKHWKSSRALGPPARATDAFSGK